MSDIALKSEIEVLINKSGFEKSKNLLCPITKIILMRHSQVSQKQIMKVANSIL